VGNGTSVDETGNLRAPTGAQRVRGLAAADNTRDFFGTDIPWDSYNVDRIEIQRGPNSILFGLGSRAGIVNASINNAEFRNFGSVDTRFGSYGTRRGSLDLNQQLIPKVLSLRLDGLWNNEKYQQKPAFQDDHRLSGELRFDPQLFKNNSSLHTSIRAKYENGKIDANRPRTVTPQDSITPWFRPTSSDPNNLQGGAGKVSSPTVTCSFLGFDLQPVVERVVNQQQPVWFIDGTSNQLYRIYGGYVNTGALSATGVPQGAGTNLNGQKYADVFSALGSFNAYANNAHLTGAQYGQYGTCR